MSGNVQSPPTSGFDRKMVPNVYLIGGPPLPVDGPVQLVVGIVRTRYLYIMFESQTLKP